MLWSQKTDGSYSSFHHEEQALVHGLYQSLPFSPGKVDPSTGRMIGEAQAAAEDKHMVLLLPVSGDTPRSWEMEGEASLSWEEEQACVCVCGKLTTGRGPTKQDHSFPCTFPSWSYTTGSYGISCLGLVMTPMWAMPPAYAYSLHKLRLHVTHHSPYQRHGHWGGTLFSALLLHRLHSGGPTWSTVLYKVLPTNQVLIQSPPPRSYRSQWRNTSSHQLQT